MMWDTSVSFSIEVHSGVKLQQTDCTVIGLGTYFSIGSVHIVNINGVNFVATICLQRLSSSYTVL